VELQADKLLKATHEASEIARDTKRDAEILPSIIKIQRATAIINQYSAGLHEQLVTAIHVDAWPASSRHPVISDQWESLNSRELRRQYHADIISPLSILHALLRQPGRDVPRISDHLSSLAATACQRLDSIDKLIDLVQRIREQATIARAIEKDSMELLHEVESLRRDIHAVSVEHTEGEPKAGDHTMIPSFQSRMETVAAAATLWESELSSRIVFVSHATPAKVDRENEAGFPLAITTAPTATASSLLPPNVSLAEPPMTPPLSPRVDHNEFANDVQGGPTGGNMIDLPALDRKVRSDVNDYSARVASAVLHCKMSLTSVITRTSDRSLSVTTCSSDISTQLSPPKTHQPITADGGTLVHAFYHREGIEVSAQQVPELVDVFGPTSVPAGSARNQSSATLSHHAASLSEHIQQLHGQLDALRIDLVARPSSSSARSTPALRRLPTRQEVHSLEDALQALLHRVDDLGIKIEHPAFSTVEAVRSRLRGAVEQLPQLYRLASVADAVKACDATLSVLLDAIDAGHLGAIEAAEEKAREAVDAVEHSAKAVMADFRVVAEIKRIQSVWKDLRSKVSDVLDSATVARATTAGSLTSIPASTARQLFPANDVRATAVRITSNPTPTASYLTPTKVSRNRSVSERPSGSRSQRFADYGVIQRGVGSNQPRAPIQSVFPTANLAAPITYSGQAYTSRFATNPRLRKSSGLGVPKPCIADPRNELDAALGDIVNKLKVRLSILHIALMLMMYVNLG